MRSVSVIQLNLSVATCLRMVHDISFVSGYDICWVFARLCAVSKQKQEQCALWEESISEKYILHYECIFYIISDFLIGFARWFALFCALFFFVPTSSPCRPFEVTVLFERDYIDLSIFSLSLDPAVTAYGRLRFLTKISAVVFQQSFSTGARMTTMVNHSAIILISRWSLSILTETSLPVTRLPGRIANAHFLILSHSIGNGLSATFTSVDRHGIIGLTDCD